MGQSKSSIGKIERSKCKSEEMSQERKREIEQSNLVQIEKAEPITDRTQNQIGFVLDQCQPDVILKINVRWVVNGESVRPESEWNVTDVLNHHKCIMASYGLPTTNLHLDVLPPFDKPLDDEEPRMEAKEETNVVRSITFISIICHLKQVYKVKLEINN